MGKKLKLYVFFLSLWVVVFRWIIFLFRYFCLVELVFISRGEVLRGLGVVEFRRLFLIVILENRELNSYFVSIGNELNVNS